MARAVLGRDRCLTFSQVELGGLEPPTPCSQSDVSARCGHADLASQLSVSSREIPRPPPVNGTLMAPRSWGLAASSCLRASWLVLALLWPPPLRDPGQTGYSGSPPRRPAD